MSKKEAHPILKGLECGEWEYEGKICSNTVGFTCGKKPCVADVHFPVGKGYARKVC